MSFNLNKRIFIPIENTPNGEVGQKTIFVFKQDGPQITANYSGGDIRGGHLFGIMDGKHTARLIYHCVTDKLLLKSGQATARFVQEPNGLVKIYMDWQWLSGGEGKGTSIYEEIKQ